MARSIASRLVHRVDVCAQQGVMGALSGRWRSLASMIVVVLAAAAGCVDVASAQNTPLAERIKQCGACHGEDGNSRMPNIPSLAGQPEFFVMNQLFIMREGVRRIEAMMPLVKDLSDDELQGLAKHFSALAPRASEAAVDPALVARGAELAGKLRCGSCHLPTLAGQDQMPRLAKQRLDYLIKALKEFRDNTRSAADTLMSAVVAGLSDADLVALAHYAVSR